MRGFSLARIIAAAIFAVGAAYELGRVVTGNPWPGVTEGTSHVTSVVLAVLWLASAALTVLARPRKVAGPLVFLGVIATLAHGVIGRFGGSMMGIVFVAAAPLLVLLLRLGWGGRLSLGAPTTVPPRTGERSVV